MHIIRLHSQALPTPNLPNIAMTIGNFDGVHLGHQALIARLQQVAQQQQLKTAIMLFEPQPLEYFLGQNAPPRITALREKLDCLKQLQIDYVFIVKFDEAIRQLTAEQFADVLRLQCNVQTLVLGDDFHFGKDRQGNSQFLRDVGFHVEDLATVQVANQRVSSTRIRQVLAEGDFALASQLLGRPYSIIGRVVRGDQIGRTLDFPTVNIALKRPKPCLQGIYAVDVALLSANQNLAKMVREQNPAKQGILGYTAQNLFGAGHVGIRPAIHQQQPEWRLEVHFPEVSADLYGQMMKVTFLHYLHGEKHYASLEALKQGIADDVQQLIAYRQNTLQFPF